MIYLAAPYTNENKLKQTMNYFELLDVAHYLIVEKRIHIFSPVMHCRDLANTHELPHDAKFWNDYNREMLRLADGLLVATLDGWTESLGVKAEILMAKEMDKRIKLINPVTYKITAYTPREIQKQKMRRILTVVENPQTSVDQSADIESHT